MGIEDKNTFTVFKFKCPICFCEFLDSSKYIELNDLVCDCICPVCGDDVVAVKRVTATILKEESV